jgi:hypothetical protein
MAGAIYIQNDQNDTPDECHIGEGSFRFHPQAFEQSISI